MSIILDGKAVAKSVREDIIKQTSEMEVKPKLAVILVGDDPASRLYVNNKEKDCVECGYDSTEYHYENTVKEETILNLIQKLNEDDSVDGILVQLPLPEHICEKHVVESIDPEKDVDAFHPINVGKSVIGDPVLYPCTPTGILELLNAYNISLESKVCVVVGRSNIVGKPMGLLMLRQDCTVIFCHSLTKDLVSLTKQADILVVATGNINLIRGDMVKDGAVVVDVAMNRDPETGKFIGDVNFEEVSKKASYITPVPGGVGPMTRAMLMKNVLIAHNTRTRK